MTLIQDKVESCVSALLKLESNISKAKDNNLFDEGQPIHMTVQCIRVPAMNKRNLRFFLPNPLIDESSEVCLFVPNLQKGRSIDYEPTVQHYQDILKEHNIERISQIIPLNQINTEYDRYELKRNLVNQFDIFLADGRITGHVQGLIGKPIHMKRKLPVPVDFRAKDLKKEIDNALSKTLMMMTGHSEKSSLKIGHTKQSVPQIAENIVAVAEELASKYPGGWENIRSLKIHLQDRASIPVYISLKSCNDVEIPVVTPRIPKKAKPVEGELTTMPGVHVTVLPDGEVIVKKRKLTKEDIEFGLSPSDLEDFDPDEEMDANSADEEVAPKVESKKKVKKTAPLSKTKKERNDDADSDVNSVDENTHVVEAAEDAYLSEWREQWNENIKRNGKKRKEMVDEDLNDVPQTKKPKILQDKTKKKKLKNGTKEPKLLQDKTKKKKLKNEGKKENILQDKTKKKKIKDVKIKETVVEDLNDVSQTKKSKDKTKKKILKNVEIKETDQKTAKQKMKKSDKLTVERSPQITPTKKLKMKCQKFAVNEKSSKNIGKKQKFSKKLVSQKKKKKFAA